MTLTPKLKQTLDFIVTYTHKNGYAPTYREIAHHPGNAMRMVDELVARGYLKRKGLRNSKRNLVLLFDAEKEPNWAGISEMLIEENRIMRGMLTQRGIKPPQKSVDY